MEDDGKNTLSDIKELEIAADLMCIKSTITRI